MIRVGNLVKVVFRVGSLVKNEHHPALGEVIGFLPSRDGSFDIAQIVIVEVYGHDDLLTLGETYSFFQQDLDLVPDNDEVPL